MTAKRLRHFSLACLLAVALAVVVLRAQNAPPGPTTVESAPTSQPAARVSADAQPLLDKLKDSYAKLNSLELAGTIAIALDGGGQHKNDSVPFTGSFKAPNQFRHDLKGEDTIVSTGAKLYAYLTTKNAYAEFDAPKARGDALNERVSALLMDQDPSLALATSADAARSMTSVAIDVSKGPDVPLDGTSYPSLKISSSDQDTRVLIDPQSGLVRQVQHDLSRSMKARGVPNVVTALITVDYSKSAITTSPDAAAFAWAPPADAKPIQANVSAGDSQEFPALALDGKPAPAFTLKDMNGGSVSLADLKGHVVVLDFWATWCGPCRIALPHVAKVAKDYAAQGVKAYAINLQESPDDVKAFLKENALDLPVLLDTDGKTAQSYLVEPIPQVVVIGKNGVIEKVIFADPNDEEKPIVEHIDAALKAN